MIDEAILEVHRRAFAPDEDIPRLVRELFAGGYAVPELSFTATSGNQVVGHVLTSWVTVEGSDARLLQLSPLGVLPEFQRQGHGSALVRRTIDAVRAMGEPALLVAVTQARSAWAFQVAVFDRDRLPQGRVRYPPPFAH